YPKMENLIAFYGGAANPHRFYIDPDSVSVGADGVVRYTLVVKAAGGATNVSYEGMRCSTGEQKLYAIGQAGGKWGPARAATWRPIEMRQYTRHYNELYEEIFCREAMIPPAPRLVSALKRAASELR